MAARAAVPRIAREISAARLRRASIAVGGVGDGGPGIARAQAVEGRGQRAGEAAHAHGAREAERGEGGRVHPARHLATFTTVPSFAPAVSVPKVVK